MYYCRYYLSLQPFLLHIINYELIILCYVFYGILEPIATAERSAR